jgi:GYF domain 2
MASGSEGFNAYEAERELSEGGPEARLGAYDENDEAVTEFAQAARERPSWLVQLTPFDRRSMSHDLLLDELQRGELIDSDTLVWRNGMHDWSTVARVGELGAPETLPPARRAPASLPVRSRRADLPRAPSDARVVLASSATAALVVVVTIALLDWAGVFEAGARADDPSLVPTSASAR